MGERRLICAGVIIVVFLALTQFAEAQKVPSADQRAGRYIFGAGLGLQANKPDGTAFALGLSGEYYVTQGFSLGPLLQMGFTGDLFQLGLTYQAKYTFDLKEIPGLKPHIEAGIGFIYADLDRGRWRSENDFSFLLPLGIGAEYRLTNSIWLDNTFLFNFTDLDVRDTHFFFTWLVGLKYRF
jgi:opacity protein-like surface antigen